MLTSGTQDTLSAGRARLREIIIDRSFREGEFTLSSGRRSNVFFNMKPTMLDPEGSNLLTEQVMARIGGIQADFVGGLAMGAVPITLPVVYRSWQTDRPLSGFWVRKEQKGHGMRQLVDGDLKPGNRVIIVEDVTTTGESALKAARVVEDASCTIACVLTIVDRCEGAKEAIEEQGYELISIFDRYDFTSKRPEDV